MRLLLFFAPSWSLTTGGPHLALPLLKGFLEENGVETIIRDLNLEISKYHGCHMDSTSANQACHPLTLQNLNKPYFQAEDKLNAIAAQYEGTWNAQLGFEYRDFPNYYSRSCLEASSLESPFTKYYTEVVIPFVQKEAPDAIGFTLASVHQIIPTLQLCHLLRKDGFPGFIVLGGNTVSRLIKEMSIPQLFTLIDGLVAFQGERPLLSLMKNIGTNGRLEDVPQLTWRTRNGDIVTNKGESSLHPNSLPVPDFRGFPIDQYWGKNFLTIVAARGCYYGKCKFCSIPYGWGKGGFAGVRSAELVYSDILTLIERHNIYRFKFVDEALSPDFMREFAQRIVSAGMKIEWEGYARIENAWFDRSFVELVAKAGFRKGYFGLELVPSDSRFLLCKRDEGNPEKMLALCNLMNIKVHFFSMHGFPGTGEEESAETIRFFLKHREEIDTVDIFPWIYAKHTSVEGVDPILDSRQDWAWKFDYKPSKKDVLDSHQVKQLASKCEEIIWREAPRLLHPTYRLVSPWSATKE